MHISTNERHAHTMQYETHTKMHTSTQKNIARAEQEHNINTTCHATQCKVKGKNNAHVDTGKKRAHNTMRKAKTMRISTQENIERAEQRRSTTSAQQEMRTHCKLKSKNNAHIDK